MHLFERCLLPPSGKPVFFGETRLRLYSNQKFAMNNWNTHAVDRHSEAVVGRLVERLGKAHTKASTVSFERWLIKFDFNCASLARR